MKDRGFLWEISCICYESAKEHRSLANIIKHAEETSNYLKKADAMFQEMEMDFNISKTQEALARL